MADGQSGTEAGKEECLAFFAFVDVYADRHPEKMELMESQAHAELRELYAGCAWLVCDEELWRRAEDWAFDRLLNELRNLWDKNHSRCLQEYAMGLWHQIAERPVRRNSGRVVFPR